MSSECGARVSALRLQTEAPVGALVFKPERRLAARRVQLEALLNAHRCAIAANRDSDFSGVMRVILEFFAVTRCGALVGVALERRTGTGAGIESDGLSSDCSRELLTPGVRGSCG